MKRVPSEVMVRARNRAAESTWQVPNERFSPPARPDPLRYSKKDLYALVPRGGPPQRLDSES